MLSIAGEKAAAAGRPAGEPAGPGRGPAARARRAHRRRARPAAGRRRRTAARARRRRGRRRGRVAQGRQRPRRPDPGPVAHGEGPAATSSSRSRSASTTSRSRSSARPPTCRGLRELLQRADAKAHVIAKIEKAEALDELDAIVDRVRRGHGRARRPRRRDRPGGGAARPEADHPLRARAREAGDHRDADARVDDHAGRSRRGPRRATSRTRSSTARRRSCSRARRRSASYPVESAAFMDRIARAVEPSLAYRHELAQAADQPSPTVGEAMSNAACDIAEVLGAAAILVPTYSGRTASAVARHRPRRPIIAVTHKRQALAADGDRVGRRAGRDRGGAGTSSTSGRARSTPRARPVSSPPATGSSSPRARPSTSPARRT